MTDYDFYRNEYNSDAIPPEEWSFYSARAGEQLARYKRMYAVSVPENQPDGGDRAVCAMAEALYSFDLLLSGGGGPVQSASIGSVSASYGAAPAVDLSPRGQERELYRCACRYLDIYRGVG